MDSTKAPYMPGVVYEAQAYTEYPAPSKSNSATNFRSYCSHCNLTFVDMVEYEHHNLTMHCQIRLITCEICTATFRRQDHLKRHMHSVHTNPKFSICPVCGKDFKRKDILLSHIRGKHNGLNEVYRCRECEFACKSLSALDKHEIKHSLVERHRCQHCTASFKRRDHMLRHVKSRHMNECVLCPICRQAYKRKDHVVRHVREKHRMGFLNGKLVKSEDLVQE